MVLTMLSYIGLIAVVGFSVVNANQDETCNAIKDTQECGANAKCVICIGAERDAANALKAVVSGAVQCTTSATCGTLTFGTIADLYKFAPATADAPKFAVEPITVTPEIAFVTSNHPKTVPNSGTIGTKAECLVEAFISDFDGWCEYEGTLNTEITHGGLCTIGGCAKEFTGSALTITGVFTADSVRTSAISKTLIPVFVFVAVVSSI